MKFSLLIPHYNHSLPLEKVLEALAPYDLPCLVVDDGSDLSHKTRLQKYEKSYSWLRALYLPINGGKGHAFKRGIDALASTATTHAIQIDADGQHDVQALSQFIRAAKAHPHAIINGIPQYDASVPKSRYYGRKITNFWVAIEIWSCQIKDAMCGFRVYPIRETHQLMTKTTISPRMAFDIEVIVRLAWQGVPVVSQPVNVNYPEDGASHFKLVRDNLAISWTHTQLFFGMLLRMPKLIRQRLLHKPARHWALLAERGSYHGMKLTLGCYRLLGRSGTRLFIVPIITYFYLMNRTARNASKTYLRYLKHVGGAANKSLSSYRHFLSFGNKLLDTLAVWNNDITLDDIDFPNSELMDKAARQGGVIFTAHLGNSEVARALSHFHPNVIINAVVFTQHAKKFNAIIEEVNPQCKINLIEVDSLSVAMTLKLQEKVENGEFLVIAADRLSITEPSRQLPVYLLEKKCALPQGPFILASLLRCPVYFMLCLKQPEGHFKVIFELLAESMAVSKDTRLRQLQVHAQTYADLLSNYCQQAPLQWFNFYDYWETRQC